MYHIPLDINKTILSFVSIKNFDKIIDLIVGGIVYFPFFQLRIFHKCDSFL